MTSTNCPQMREARLAQLYLVLRDRAAEAALCPTNDEIACHVGLSGKNNFSRMFAILEDRGLIKTRVYPRGRVVTIVETGQSTAAIIPKAKPPMRAGPAPRLAAEAVPATIPISIDRSPCPACGTRGDIGCNHRRNAQ